MPQICNNLPTSPLLNIRFCCQTTPVRLRSVRHSGSALVSINVVTLRRSRLVLGWVTVAGSSRVYLINYPDQLSLAILLWVGQVSTGDVHDRCWRDREFCVKRCLHVRIPVLRTCMRIHVRTCKQTGHMCCVPVLHTDMQYRYCVPVRTCKQTAHMYAIHVRRFKHV